jgi:hypothetical protein
VRFIFRIYENMFGIVRIIFWHVFFTQYIHTHERETKKKEDDKGKYYQTALAYILCKKNLCQNIISLSINIWAMLETLK